MFQPEDASTNVVNTKTVANELHREEQLTFHEKIEADDEPPEYHPFDRPVESNTSPVSPREITIEFLDSRNCEKFDRLVRDVKIVAPFIRRLSANSRSNSPVASMVSMEEYEIGTEAAATVAGITTIDQYDRQGCPTMSYPPTTVIAHTESENQFFGGAANVAEVAATTYDHDRIEDNIFNSSTTDAIIAHIKRRRHNVELETRPEVLARRQKQIDYGRNTIGYDNYIKLIPRNRRLKDDPRTPPKELKYSRRAFDGLVKTWRTKLHRFDPPSDSNEMPVNHGCCGFHW